jgi:glycerol-3-phosphate O-acyltransferase
LDQTQESVYVLQHRALTDLIVLDLVCDQNDLVSPLSPLTRGTVNERSRFFPLMRATFGRVTMQTLSPRLTRLIQADDAFKAHCQLIPVSVFWGRGLVGDSSWLKILTSENWAASGRIKRLLNLLINRRNIVVHFGQPISLREASQAQTEQLALRRTARYLRVRLQRQRVRTLGPDFSHRRTLLAQVVNSASVQKVIAEDNSKPKKKLNKLAAKYARTIASDMSHPTVRVLSRLLTWFWGRIYDRVEIEGLKHIEDLSLTHTLVYVPSHRSHLDYLLLSYLLYYENFMVPHIAAGDNLNLPILGGILRRGGAFFMRRSFRDDPLYAAVFEEYLYQVYRRGHSVEFFTEGGRSRTGRLLPAKFGLLRMTLAAQERGLRRPLAIVPVYIAYEKLVEAASYLSELRGENKRRESLGEILQNIRLIRQDFGNVRVNIGQPIAMDEWLQQHPALKLDERADALGQEIHIRINNAAHVNPVNLVSLVTLSTPRFAIEQPLMEDQLTLYRRMIRHLWSPTVTICDLPPEAVIDHTRKLGLVDQETHEYGSILAHEPATAILMTWYRNNVAHLLAYPALIACLVLRRRFAVNHDQLSGMVDTVFPYIARELSCRLDFNLNQTLDIMSNAKLLTVANGEISAPPQGSRAHLQLALLADLVMPTLERMFIVISQMRTHTMSKDELQPHVRQLAQKISRLYGLNAPEFSDGALFDQFLDNLLINGIIVTDTNGNLHGETPLENILRAAQFVIDPQIQLGVASHTPEPPHQTQRTDGDHSEQTSPLSVKKEDRH